MGKCADRNATRENPLPHFSQREEKFPAPILGLFSKYSLTQRKPFTKPAGKTTLPLVWSLLCVFVLTRKRNVRRKVGTNKLIFNILFFYFNLFPPNELLSTTRALIHILWLSDARQTDIQYPLGYGNQSRYQKSIKPVTMRELI